MVIFALWHRRADADGVAAADPTNGFSASAAESHPLKFFAESSGLCRICGLLEAIRKFKEDGPPVFVRCYGIFQEIDDRTIAAVVPL